jgi:hypothetical protein
MGWPGPPHTPHADIWVGPVVPLTFFILFFFLFFSFSVFFFLRFSKPEIFLNSIFYNPKF